ncbi:hypothetical protein M431DRAFT_11806 [Trichoderma harzianum CBS 226.95]|uniref:Uncharacterized protein n=1 Tax=Trichoderma harzianum CBS 226.95 TaxID=983964 RepID=A0A2T3ZRB8_TRIHA|nr:hypothetical protein M431DRAFT_11806 [Trichoderma harzianum CBS 226.95]PTB47341.1 hypothetical protein M431DRAFT_11806 [Trichoderma harzianum CBS 226.95]
MADQMQDVNPGETYEDPTEEQQEHAAMTRLVNLETLVQQQAATIQRLTGQLQTLQGQQQGQPPVMQPVVNPVVNLAPVARQREPGEIIKPALPDKFEGEPKQI